MSAEDLRDQKKEVDPLELKIRAVVSYHSGPLDEQFTLSTLISPQSF